MKIRSYGGGSLVCLDVLDGDGCHLYTLEVGRNSGTVCIRTERDFYHNGKKVETFVQFDDVTRFCGEMPEMVQDAILVLFDGKVSD